MSSNIVPSDEELRRRRALSDSYQPKPSKGGWGDLADTSNSEVAQIRAAQMRQQSIDASYRADTITRSDYNPNIVNQQSDIGAASGLSDFDLYSMVRHYKLPLTPPGVIDTAYSGIPDSTISNHLQGYKPQPRPVQAMQPPTPNVFQGGQVGYGQVSPDDPRSDSQIMAQAHQDHINWLNSINQGNGQAGTPNMAQLPPSYNPPERQGPSVMAQAPMPAPQQEVAASAPAPQAAPASAPVSADSGGSAPPSSGGDDE